MTLTVAQQLDAVMRQVVAARDLVPLRAVGAELHPPAMLVRPVNPVGAHLRAAYWYAVAARPVVHGGPRNDAMFRAAGEATQAAEAAMSGPTFSLAALAEDPEAEIDRILYRAEEATRRARRPDIAAQLHGMRIARKRSQDYELSTASGRSWAALVLGSAFGAPFVIAGAAGLALLTYPVWGPALGSAVGSAWGTATRRR